MNIVLCGMMGVGKSSVGVRIAELTGRMWYDTDVVITDRHGRISDIFEFYGEAHFRSLETEIVRELSERDNLVISTGGGLVLKPENSELLKNTGKTAETLGTLLSERTPVYEHVADYIIETDGKSVEEVADEIVSCVGPGAVVKA